MAMTHADRKAFIAKTTKQRDTITQIDADMDKAMSRVIRWTNKLAELRTKRKRVVRELAKSLAH